MNPESDRFLFWEEKIRIVKIDLPEIIASIIISLIFIIIGIIWNYIFRTKKKKGNGIIDKKKGNKNELYANIFLIVVFSLFNIFLGLFFWPIIIIYIIILFGELIVFSKFKNENVTWTQITQFIAMSLFVSCFLLALFIFGNLS